jgi:lysine 2,3-aminomutase
MKSDPGADALAHAPKQKPRELPRPAGKASRGLSRADRSRKIATARAERSSLTRAAALVEAGLAPQGRLAELERVGERYAIAITPAAAALIDRGDARDPIARQFVPDAAELERGPQDLADPIGDRAHSPLEGLVHRYPDRALVKLVSLCPVYCRFCFRREMIGPKSSGTLSRAAIDAILGYLGERPEIWEVILSGGDPFILSARRLRDIVARFAEIPHIKVMRWHTRVPVVAPERIDAALVRALKSGGKAVFVALHANHPRELTGEARAACVRLIDAGIPMLSQTVLLKGVNDDEATLAELMRAFVEMRIRPYYLHHLDRAPGTAHLAVPIERGQALMRALRGRLSGLCQPSYVLDIPGGHGKSPIGPSYLAKSDGAPNSGQEAWTVEDFTGAPHSYRAD